MGALKIWAKVIQSLTDRGMIVLMIIFGMFYLSLGNSVNFSSLLNSATIETNSLFYPHSGHHEVTCIKDVESCPNVIHTRVF